MVKKKKSGLAANVGTSYVPGQLALILWSVSPSGNGVKTLPTHCRDEAVLKQSFRAPESPGRLVGVGKTEMGSLLDSLPRMYKAVGLNPGTSKMNEW